MPGFAIHDAAFNLLFAAFVFFITPFLGTAVLDSLEGEANYVLAAIMILAQVAEFFFLPARMKVANGRLKEDAGSALILLILHMLVGVVMAGMTLTALGVDPTEDEYLFGGIMFPVVIKELIILVRSLGEFERNREHRAPIYDLGLIFVSYLYWTVIWSAIGRTPPVQPQGAEMIVHMLAAAVLFLIFYTPLRIPYLMEDWHGISGKNAKTLSVLTMLLAAGASLYHVFF